MRVEGEGGRDGRRSRGPGRAHGVARRRGEVRAGTVQACGVASPSGAVAGDVDVAGWMRRSRPDRCLLLMQVGRLASGGFVWSEGQSGRCAGRRSRRGSGGPPVMTGRDNPRRSRPAVHDFAAGFVTGSKNACGGGPAGSRDIRGSGMGPGPTRERIRRGSCGGGLRLARISCTSGTCTLRACASF